MGDASTASDRPTVTVVKRHWRLWRVLLGVAIALVSDGLGWVLARGGPFASAAGILLAFVGILLASWLVPLLVGRPPPPPEPTVLPASGPRPDCFDAQ